MLFFQSATQAYSVNYEESKFPGTIIAREQGGDNQSRMTIPLKKTRVALELTGNILRSEVTQTFTNETKTALEAVYIFPLPSNSTVMDMSMEFDERIVKSVVKEKLEAKVIYEEAKAAGKKAALLDQSRPNIFKTSIANFMPGETVRIKLTYIEAVEYKKGMYEVNFPMAVGPRYIPVDMANDRSHASDVENITAPILHPAIDSGHRLHLTLSISGIPVESVKSTTHSIKSHKLDKSTQVSLAETIPNADFNVKVILDKNRESQATLVEGQVDQDVYSMINIFPPTIEPASSELIPRDVIFLIDTSGSMNGDSISQARSGLKKCMKMLTERDMFSIVRFSDSYSFLSPNMLKASELNLEMAYDYIDGLDADGGTEMQPALDYCLRIKGRPEASRLLVFLTDGDVGNEDSLMRLVNAKLEKTRMFTFGIGSSPNEYLMRKMAELGKGQSRFIHSHEDISVVMNDFFKTLASPVMTDVSIALYDENEKEISDYQIFPRQLPDLFHERPLRAFIKSRESIKIAVVSGVVNGEKVIDEYFVNKDKTADNTLVSRLYGREAIKDLMYKYIFAGQQDSIDEMKTAIIKTALRHQLVSQFTSRVAVEEKISRAPDGTINTVKVPNNLPRGMAAGNFTATGTDDLLLILIGAALTIFGMWVVRCTYIGKY